MILTNYFLSLREKEEAQAVKKEIPKKAKETKSEKK